MNSYFIITNGSNAGDNRVPIAAFYSVLLKYTPFEYLDIFFVILFKIMKKAVNIAQTAERLRSSFHAERL